MGYIIGFILYEPCNIFWLHITSSILFIRRLWEFYHSWSLLFSPKKSQFQLMSSVYWCNKVAFQEYFKWIKSATSHWFNRLVFFRDGPAIVRENGKRSVWFWAAKASRVVWVFFWTSKSSSKRFMVRLFLRFSQFNFFLQSCSWQPMSLKP